MSTLYLTKAWGGLLHVITELGYRTLCGKKVGSLVMYPIFQPDYAIEDSKPRGICRKCEELAKEADHA